MPHSTKSASELTFFNFCVLTVFPVFSKSPNNVTIRTGTTARLDCAATGLPAPQIGWNKDGGSTFPALSERRMNVMPSDDAFFIVNVKAVDAGVYSCTAENKAGKAAVNASIFVSGNSEDHFHSVRV